MYVKHDLFDQIRAINGKYDNIMVNKAKCG